MMFGLDEEALALIKHAIAFVNPLRAVIFGSRARGTHRYNSDIDIAVFGCSYEELLTLGSLLEGLPLFYSFDVVGYEGITSEGLRASILFDGIEIYKRDPVREQIIKSLDELPPEKESRVLEFIQSIK